MPKESFRRRLWDDIRVYLARLAAICCLLGGAGSSAARAHDISPRLTWLPGTAYTFKAFATNSEGTTYSGTPTFATPSATATLSTLTVSSGTLSPVFASGTTSYTATVSHATTSLTVTPVASQAQATIEVRVNAGAYAAVASGVPSGALPLIVGANTVDVRVTAQDGATQATYTVAVSRTSALTELSQYDGTGTAPTLMTYAGAGIPGVSLRTMGSANSALALLAENATDSVEEITSIVTAYTTILDAAAGLASPTLSDLAAVGGVRLSTLRLPFMVAAIAATSDDGQAVATVAGLQAILDATEAVGVRIDGPATVAFDTQVSLTLRIIDTQGRNSILTESVRLGLLSSHTGIWSPDSPLLLAAGTTTQKVTYRSAVAGAHTLTATWLDGLSSAAAPGRSGGTHAVTVLRGAQSLTIGEVPTQALTNGSVTVSVSATSGLSVLLNSSTPTVCSLSGSVVSLHAVGNCTIVAAQEGDGQWQAAVTATRSFAVVVPTVTLERARTTMEAAGAASTVAVTVTPASTQWSAVSSADWLSTQGAGVGNGTIGFVAAPHTGPRSRTATIVVGGAGAHRHAGSGDSADAARRRCPRHTGPARMALRRAAGTRLHP